MYTKKKEFRISEEIERLLIARSTELNMSSSEYIRQLIKADFTQKTLNTITDFREDLKTTIKELNSIGNNLNQVARYTNKDKILTQENEIKIIETVEKLVDIIKKIS